MHDPIHDRNAERHDSAWRDALAALPLETPDTNAWPQVLARLPAADAAPRRRSRQRAFALAAVLAAAAAVPFAWMRAPAPHVDGTAPAIAASADPLAGLQAESAGLERLLRATRDNTTASGTALVLSAELDDRLAAIDIALLHPRDADDARRLWQTRVAVLRDAVDLEGSRRWLASQGQRYDAAFVRID